MDRNREARRVAMATPNGLSRRRHRTSSHRDSPEDDGPLELQESARFRDRTGKKERDREKERSERDRLSRSKRRRGEKYMHREDGGDDSSEESLNDDDEEDQEDLPASHMPSNPVSVSSSSFPSSALSSRKSYPPPSKVFKVAPTWRGPSETIGFTIPRKARTASTKRAHDSWSSVGVAGEQILRQASSSPLRPAMAASSAAASPSPAPVSPSSSSLSMKKKIKVSGAKQRPQKSSSKSPFTVQDEIEIEVAEVLYGLMRQSQGSSKPETMQNDSVKYDSREANRSTGDSKSRASSPISNSGSIQLQDSPAMLQNSSSSTPPLSAVAPKRKRPRPVSQLEEIPAGFASRSSPIPTAAKTESDLPAKQEVHPPKPGKKSDSAADDGGLSLDFTKSHGPQSTPGATRLEPASGVLSSEDNRPAADLSLGKETAMPGKAEEVPSPKKESADDRAQISAILELATTTTTTGEKESRREEKFEIDLMAPPPPSRSSPEREREMNHNEAKVTDGEAEPKSKPSEGEEEKAGKSISGDSNAVDVEKGTQSSVSGAEDGLTQKINFSNKARKVDLHLDLERLDRNAAPIGAEEGKLSQQPPLLNPWRNDTGTDKTAQPSSLPLSMSVPPGWPAGLPPMGFAPLQGVVSMDGRSMAPAAIQPPHFLFTQPRPGRCATHCYIAKNIFSHQQFMKNYPFWPAPAGPAPLFSAKPYNLNVAAAADLHGNAAVRGDVNPVQEKGQTLAFFPGQQQPAVEDKGPQPAAANAVDGAQKKQFYQSLPPGGGPNNIMHGPATLFFPLGQQQQVNAAGASASARPNSAKSPIPAGTAPSTSVSTSVPNAAASSGQTSSTTMGFNYPNMPANETQYLAILANGAYQFPIPAHVGAAQAYRGAHPQVMPFFNGSYYPSQMLHPSRLQQQQQAPPGAQPMQIQQNQHNPSVSIASSSSQKHTQNQQQRPQGSSANGTTASPGLQNFPAPKTRASQTQQLEMGGEGSPSTADSRLSRPSNNVNVYGQNFALPFNPSSFAMMTTPASLTGTANGNHAEKKQQQPQTQQQQQHQAFAMSFASMNGAAANLDIASMAQNHAFLQSLPEAARNNYHIMAAAAAAQAAQQRKNHHGSEDGKSGARDPSNPDDERKGTAAKASASAGQSLAFSRPDMAETSAPTVSGNNVLDSSARSLDLTPGSVHSSHTSSTSSMSDRELQKHLQKFASSSRRHRVAPFTSKAAAANRAPVTSNGSIYSDQLAALATKYPPNTYSGYAQSVIQGGSTQTHSSQWQNSGRAINSQGSSPSMPTSMKNMGQQEGRTQQGHTQISFGGNPKAAAPSQGQQQGQSAAATQSPPPPMRVGSPSTSSVSRGHSGSPRMNSPSAMGNKSTQASSLSNQPGKNSVSGRNGPSVLGNSQVPATSSMGTGKPQLQQQQQLSQQQQQQLSQHQLQQPLSKQSIQQAQMFFNNAYLQTHSATTSSAAVGFQLQRHRAEQHQPPPNTQAGPTASLSATANDPSKAVAATGNVKGGKQPQGGALPAAGFPYAHEVAAAGRMQAERKQTAD